MTLPSPTDEDLILVCRQAAVFCQLAGKRGERMIDGLLGAADRLESLLSDRAKLEEPTPEMIEAGIKALDDCVDSDWDSGPDGESHNSYTVIRSDAAAIIYRAMVAALNRSTDRG